MSEPREPMDQPMPADAIPADAPMPADAIPADAPMPAEPTPADAMPADAPTPAEPTPADAVAAAVPADQPVAADAIATADPAPLVPPPAPGIPASVHDEIAAEVAAYEATMALPDGAASPDPAAAPSDAADAADAVPAYHRPPRKRLAGLRDIGSGMAAVGVKELRGRMRGKRAFVILTIHLLLVAGFAWMIESLSERSFSGGFSSSFSASSEIGRQLFLAIVFLLSLITLILAPASTAGAISLEREKQTLDLLTTTPISSLAIVLGKLFSALSWILLLLLASIPVVALVFTFGGVGPDDVIRSYLILLATAFCFGSIGLFVSALVKRTQAATVINLVSVIALTAGTAFLFIFWTAMTGNSGVLPDQPVARFNESPIDSLTRRPPEALMWFNPFVAQVDVMCGTETGFGSSCQIIAGVTAQNTNFVGDNTTDFGIKRDTYWPRSIAAMLVVSLLLIVLSVQLVSPTRRWRLRLPRPRRRPAGSTA